MIFARKPVNRSHALMLVVVAFAIAGCFALLPGGVDAKSVRYAQFDVALDLQNDGSFAVTETQQVDFEGGPFSRGFRSIPLARTNGITNITVGELLGSKVEPYDLVDSSDLDTDSRQFAYDLTPSTMEIQWTFGETYSRTRIFVVSYVMLGAMRSYPDLTPPNQQIWFTAVGSALSSQTPVDSATVTVSLPQAVSLSDPALAAEGPGADEAALISTDGKVFTWTQDGVGSGDEVTIRLQFPPVATNAAVPDWQARDDAQRAREAKNDERSAVIHLMMLAAGLLLVAGGGASAYGLWYTRGRDPHTGLVADFVPNPPDDLPPGVAGTLIDEIVHERDIVATILDLARRGVISMTEVGPMGSTGLTRGDYMLELKRVEESHPRFERRMLDAIFGNGAEVGAASRLSQSRAKVVSAYPEFKQDLYAELVSRGLCNKSPEETRRTWGQGGLIIALAGVIGAIVGTMVFDRWVLIPGLALISMGFVYRRLGKAMPRKTDAGAEKAAWWRAFKRYLDDIEKYEKLDETTEIFDKYLAYTTAFGIEKSWLEKFSRVNTPSPEWFGPDVGDVGLPRRRHAGSWGGGTWIGPSSSGGSHGSGGGIDLPDFDLPDLQKTSNKSAQALQGGSSGLMDVLKVAGAILEIASTFSGGGGSGGSSGGGGGGFS